MGASEASFSVSKEIEFKKKIEFYSQSFVFVNKLLFSLNDPFTFSEEHQSVNNNYPKETVLLISSFPNFLDLLIMT